MNTQCERTAAVVTSAPMYQMLRPIPSKNCGASTLKCHEVLPLAERSIAGRRAHHKIPMNTETAANGDRGYPTRNEAVLAVSTTSNAQRASLHGTEAAPSPPLDIGDHEGEPRIPSRFVCSAVGQMTVVAGAPRFSSPVALIQDAVRVRSFLMTEGPLPVGAHIEVTTVTGHRIRATVAQCAHHGWGIFRIGVQFDGATPV